MRKSLFLTVAFWLCVLLLMTACVGTGDIQSTSTSTDDATSEMSAGDTATEAPPETTVAPQTDAPITANATPAVTTAPTTTGADTALIVPAEPSDVADIEAPGAVKAAFAEPLTTTRGTVEMKNVMAGLTYTSTFYGHDSAIDRDYVQYGWKLTTLRHKFDTPDTFFLYDVTGDIYADMISYADGTLTIRPAIVRTNQSFTYNGTTQSSVYASQSSGYAFGGPVTFTLGITATLRGVGDFNADGYADLLLIAPDSTVLFALASGDGFTVRAYGRINGDANSFHTGDANGDGLCDLIYIDGTVFTTVYFDGTAFTVGETTACTLPIEPIATAVADANNDGRADIILTADSRVLTLFGRGNGQYGPRTDEIGTDEEGSRGNTNLYAEATTRVQNISSLALGDLTGDGVPDYMAHGTVGSNEATYLMLNADEPAYDYSLFGFITDDGTYKMYAGGRWFDQSDALADSLIGDGTGDGDHVMLYFSEDGITWERYLDGPAFYLGVEQGQDGWQEVGDGWWTGNTLEPEVIYADGVYHMFIQSSGETRSGYYGDYLGYASSTDGIHFLRKTDSPIIIPKEGTDFTQFKEICGYEIGFNHQEVIYVADDPDGKCFWLYTGHFKDNSFAGYVRIRSSEPTTFLWSERESTTGFSQIGNQIGYIRDYDGTGTDLFLRITYHEYEDENGKRSIPTLQYSTDGLTFSGTGVNLASVDVTQPVTERNRNVCFLGFCTLNGTGEIPRNADGSYRLIYLATTSASAVAPEIFYAEAGVGVMDFTVEIY